MHYSGKFVLRLDSKLHKTLKNEALNRQTSLNQLIVSRLLQANEKESLSPVIQTIVAAFDNLLEGVILFGSQARGDSQKNSDIDLLIVLKNETPISRSLYKQWDLNIAPVIGDKYSPQFSHFPDINNLSSLWLEVGLEGVVWLDNSGSVKSMLADIKNKIATGVYRKKYTHGQSYWVKEVINEK